ncbi:hypothetical protein [Acinetobacter chinensis]|uniref:hypothetical protein n=1 Tax=Acinetobacter chinensis TaxID=2004650 RepID=UPI001D0DA0F5|nr:hypothetical protein [Acinetobacter chinensis]
MNEKDQPKSKAENYKFHFKYLPTKKIEEGLEKYIPHPIWVEFYDYEDTDDLYIQKNNENKVITSIRCSNTNVDLARKCSMTWTLEPKMKILLKVTFQRSNLKDWKLIKRLSEEEVNKLFINKMLD